MCVETLAAVSGYPICLNLDRLRLVVEKTRKNKCPKIGSSRRIRGCLAHFGNATRGAACHAKNLSRKEAMAA